MFNYIINSTLTFIPIWIWPISIILGLIIYFSNIIIQYIPILSLLLSKWTIFSKLIAGIIVICGSFLYGAAGVELLLNEKINELNKKIALAEQQSQQINTKIVTQIKTVTKVVHDKQIVIQHDIDANSDKINKDCKLDPSVISILNEASTSPVKNTK